MDGPARFLDLRAAHTPYSRDQVLLVKHTRQARDDEAASQEGKWLLSEENRSAAGRQHGIRNYAGWVAAAHHGKDGTGKAVCGMGSRVRGHRRDHAMSAWSLTYGSRRIC